MRRRLIVVALVLAGGACGTEAAPSEAPEPPRVAGASSLPTPWTRVRPPHDAALLEAPAIARVTEDANGSVAALVSVRVERIHVRAGSRVDAGDPIMDVHAPAVVQAAVELLSARRRASVHRARVEHLEALRAEGLVDGTEAFAQRAEEAVSRAEQDRASGVLRGAGLDPRQAARIARRGVLTLVAPVSGVVATLQAERGQIREPDGPPLATIVGAAPARIEVQTSERWPEARSLVFSTVDGREVELSPEVVASVVAPDSGAWLTWFSPRDPDARFADGLRGTVRLTAAQEVLEVPVDAVVQETGASHVVRRRSGEVHLVPVRVVATSGASAMVIGDLHEDDEVAADGAAAALLNPSGRGSR